jgi:hypothetical protein
MTLQTPTHDLVVRFPLWCKTIKIQPRQSPNRFSMYTEHKTKVPSTTDECLIRMGHALHEQPTIDASDEVCFGVEGVEYTISQHGQKP